MLVYCGLDCGKCEIAKAGKSGDPAAKEKVARGFSEKFGWNLSPEDISCDGCTADGGVLFQYCAGCAVRSCARERGIENCAACEDYGCEKLSFIFKANPASKENLERLRREL